MNSRGPGGYSFKLVPLDEFIETYDTFESGEAATRMTLRPNVESPRVLDRDAFRNRIASGAGPMNISKFEWEGAILTMTEWYKEAKNHFKRELDASESLKEGFDKFSTLVKTHFIRRTKLTSNGQPVDLPFESMYQLRPENEGVRAKLEGISDEGKFDDKRAEFMEDNELIDGNLYKGINRIKDLSWIRWLFAYYDSTSTDKKEVQEYLEYVDEGDTDNVLYGLLALKL